jgi:hypothetical protein
LRFNFFFCNTKYFYTCEHSCHWGFMMDDFLFTLSEQEFSGRFRLLIKRFLVSFFSSSKVHFRIVSYFFYIKKKYTSNAKVIINKNINKSYKQLNLYTCNSVAKYLWKRSLIIMASIFNRQIS